MKRGSRKKLIRSLKKMNDVFPCEQTNMSKNITFPQLRLRPVTRVHSSGMRSACFTKNQYREGWRYAPHPVKRQTWVKTLPYQNFVGGWLKNIPWLDNFVSDTVSLSRCVLCSICECFPLKILAEAKFKNWLIAPAENWLILYVHVTISKLEYGSNCYM